MKKSVLIALLVGLSATATAAKPVFNWKEGNGVTKYSDTPRGLKLGKSNVMNVRTQTVVPQSAARPAVPESLADRQAQLSQEIAMRNRQIEEYNAKALEHNQKLEQCNNARSSRRLAESARNRDQLIQKYDEEISRFCN